MDLPWYTCRDVRLASYVAITDAHKQRLCHKHMSIQFLTDHVILIVLLILVNLKVLIRIGDNTFSCPSDVGIEFETASY